MPPATLEPPVNLELRIQPDDDAIVLCCDGQIIAGDTSLAFRSAVLDLLHRHHNIIVDLSGVHCMDRRGLETVVSLYSSARTAQARVRFVNLKIEISDSHPRSNQLQTRDSY